MNGSEEGVSLAKMIIIILLVLFVLGLVVGAVYMFGDKFSGVLDSLTGTLDSAETSVYSPYDNQVVTGDDIISCCKAHRGQDIAIIIQDGAATPYNMSTGIADGTVINGYNYNALLSGATPGTAVGIPYSSQGYFKYDLGIDLTTNPTGQPTYNTNFAPITNKTNAATFVKQTGQYYSMLLYSGVTDKVCGIVFLRM